MLNKHTPLFRSEFKQKTRAIIGPPSCFHVVLEKRPVIDFDAVKGHPLVGGKIDVILRKKEYKSDKKKGSVFRGCVCVCRELVNTRGHPLFYGIFSPSPSFPHIYIHTRFATLFTNRGYIELLRRYALLL